jgi:hypothetical protein
MTGWSPRPGRQAGDEHHKDAQGIRWGLPRKVQIAVMANFLLMIEIQA